MSLHWYPGHMAAALRAIRENAKLVDVIIEVVDARAPAITRDPAVSKISSRPRVIALAKADLAETGVTRRWAERLRSQGTPAYPVNARSGEGVIDLLKGCKPLLGERARRQRAGSGGRALRVMVVGVPNVGKSSLINRMTSGRSARTGAAPGVTRGKQWVRTAEGLEVLDLPGVLRLGKVSSSDMFKLAVLGIIPETSYDPYQMALDTVRFLSAAHGAVLAALGATAGASAEEVIAGIGRAKGFLARGGEVDLVRTATWFLGQIREGKAGRLSLETP
ncbi:MAG: ribosome biogenesis GTPase YlqF [Ignavibacteriales bacterium]